MGSIQDEIEFCFVCDREVLGHGICMSLAKTNFSNTDFPTKVSQMIGDTFMVIVREEDVICTRCASLINETDKLEVDLTSAKKIIIGLLNTKYNLNDEEEELPGNNPVNGFEQPEIKTDDANYSFSENTAAEAILNHFSLDDLENESNQFQLNESEKMNMTESLKNGVHVELETNVDNTVHIKAEPLSYKYDNQLTNQLNSTSENNIIAENSFEVSLALEEDILTGLQDHNSDSKTICESSRHIIVGEVKKEISLDSCPKNTECPNKLKFNKLNINMTKPDQLLINKKPLQDIPSLKADNKKPPVKVIVEVDEKGIMEHIQVTPKPKKRTIIKYKKFGEKNNSVKRFRPILPKITSLANFLKLTSSSTSIGAKSSSLNGKIIKRPRFTQKINSNQINHIKLAYTETFVCTRCQKTFEDFISLQNHRKEMICPFVCGTCGESFKSRRGLMTHRARHTGRYAYCCDVCGRGFTEKAGLTAHQRCHTKETPFVCEVCGKTFQHQPSYWIHRRWHDNPLPYQCEHCGRKFKHTSRLAVHRRMHTGERPYHCTHCPLTFTIKGSLNRHMMLHTKEFPYNCEPCGRGFTTGTKYRLHMTTVHQVIYEKRPMNKKDYKVAVYEDEAPNTIEEQPEASHQTTFGVTYEATENVMQQFDELCDSVVEIIGQPCEQLSDAILLPNDWLN